jgi:hypothetical protein
MCHKTPAAFFRRPAYGGSGEVWISDAKIDVVGRDVVPTGAPPKTLPGRADES